jgi:hypothetical protein
MKFSKFYVEDKNGRTNCVIRSFCKLYGGTYEDAINELLSIKEEINAESFNDIEVFEEYMRRRDTDKIEYGKDTRIKDLNIDNGNYIVFCWDKDNFYHMVTIMDNTLYDKDDTSSNLYAITVYKQKVLKK